MFKDLRFMTKILTVALIIGIIEWLRTGYIDGLSCLWLGPALIMLADDGLLEDWAQKKLEEK
ncbi:MAG: hypothetical protein MSS24_07830 [Clostridiales bacterium]|nr:hypothetical protein [Clostridiales bacterium]